MRSLIRHISSSSKCEYFLAAEFEKSVHIFKKGNPHKIMSVETHLSFGGRRLQIMPDQDLFVAGAYNVYGIEAYSLISGNQIWKRKDFKRVQRITLHPSTASISCFFENAAGQIVNSLSGETISKYHGVQGVYFSDTGEFCLEEKKQYQVKRNLSPIFEIVPESFAVLDVSFSNDTVAISESGKDTRLICTDNGNIAGRYVPPKGYHVLSINYDKDNKFFVGVQFGYESTGDYSIIHIDRNGTLKKEFKIDNAYAHDFLGDRKTIINANGEEIDYTSGKVIMEYDFPKAK